jgi:plastocyanin
MLSSRFSPTSLSVTEGTTVHFVNDSGVGHTVMFDGTRPPGVADILLHSSGTNDRIFTTAGTFAFHCSIHAGMNGQIVVTAAGGYNP